MLCDNNQSLLCTDTRYRRGLRDRLWPCWQLHQQRTCRRNGGELRSHDFVPYRECGDAPGWYPASTLAASASHSAAARVAKAPAEEKGGGVEVWREAPGTNLPGGGVTLSGPGAAAGDEAGVESDGRARFFGCTEEQRREKQRGALRCVPSLSAFLNPPTLRPSPSQALSRRPPPARHQTAALATFFFYLFNIFSAR